MDIHVDISIFCDKTSSYGVLSGILNVPTVPAVGDCVSFLNPLNDARVEATSTFSGLLAVEKIVIVPGAPGQILCDLEDVVFDSEAEAQQFADYLETGFNLGFERHNL